MIIQCCSGRKSFAIFALLFGVSLVAYNARWTWTFLDRHYNLLPFSAHGQVQNFDFEDTLIEQQCFDGAAMPSNRTEPLRPPIPKTVHFIYAPTPADPNLTFLHYLAIRAALLSLTPSSLTIHHSYLNLTNPWYLKLAHAVTLVHYSPTSRFWPADKAAWNEAHLVDLLRLSILQRAGGIYLDIDVFALRPFDTLLANQRDLILGHEGGNRGGLCNGVILARPASKFLQRWIDSYASFDPAAEWNYHSVVLPKEMERRHPEEVCTLSPSAFFYPTWTYRDVDFMHVELTPEEAEGVRETLEGNGGALYANQLAYHAWNHPAWKYLTRLTPEVIRGRDTRFNMMVRRFLDDD